MYLKVLVFSLISTIVFTGCIEQEETKIEKPKTKIVKILDLKDSKKVLESFEYPAQVEALQDSTMAFEVSGKIVKFYYQEGQKVKKDSIIAKLDDTIFKANYDSAKANFSQANIDYQRYKKLFNSKAVAKIELEKQRQNLDVRKAALQVAKKNLDETKLVAEFDGIMAKKMVADFARVTAKQPIVRLQNNSSYKIKFFVPESDILQLKGELSPEYISSIVNFYVTLGNEKDKKYEAKLIDISTTAEEITRTFEATLQMQPQKHVNILPGMTAQVKAIAKKQREKKIFIPYKAIFSDSTKSSFIWVVNKNNEVLKQQIKIGELIGDSAEIVDGLDGVSKIVTSGISFLEAGDRVKEYKKLDK